MEVLREAKREEPQATERHGGVGFGRVRAPQHDAELKHNHEQEYEVEEAAQCGVHLALMRRGRRVSDVVHAVLAMAP